MKGLRKNFFFFVNFFFLFKFLNSFLLGESYWKVVCLVINELLIDAKKHVFSLSSAGRLLAALTAEEFKVIKNNMY